MPILLAASAAKKGYSQRLYDYLLQPVMSNCCIKACLFTKHKASTRGYTYKQRPAMPLYSKPLTLAEKNVCLKNDEKENFSLWFFL